MSQGFPPTRLLPTHICPHCDALWCHIFDSNKDAIWNLASDQSCIRCESDSTGNLFRLTVAEYDRILDERIIQGKPFWWQRKDNPPRSAT